MNTVHAWSAEVTPNAVAVLELARIAAYCRNPDANPTSILNEIRTRITTLKETTP